VLSDDRISPLEPLSNTQHYTLGNLSEDEKIEIIKTGFQLQAEGKISLKKYYESTVFQLKGYNIKYGFISNMVSYQI